MPNQHIHWDLGKLLNLYSSNQPTTRTSQASQNHDKTPLAKSFLTKLAFSPHLNSNNQVSSCHHYQKRTYNKNSNPTTT